MLQDLDRSMQSSCSICCRVQKVTLQRFVLQAFAADTFAASPYIQRNLCSTRSYAASTSSATSDKGEVKAEGKKVKKAVQRFMGCVLLSRLQ